MILWNFFFAGVFGLFALGGWALLRARRKTHRVP